MAHSGDPFPRSTLTRSAGRRVVVALAVIAVLWLAITWAAMLP